MTTGVMTDSEEEGVGVGVGGIGVSVGGGCVFISVIGISVDICAVAITASVEASVGMVGGLQAASRMPSKRQIIIVADVILISSTSFPSKGGGRISVNERT